VYSDTSTPDVLRSILAMTSVKQIVLFDAFDFLVENEVKNKLKSINLRHVDPDVRIVCSNEWIELFRSVFSTLKVSSSRIDNPHLTTQQNSLIGGVMTTNKRVSFPQWF